VTDTLIYSKISRFADNPVYFSHSLGSKPAKSMDYPIKITMY